MRKKISLFLATLMTMIGVANMQSDTQVVQAADGIKLLVDSMTTQQKVAQMIMPAFRGWEGSGKWVDATMLSSEQLAVLKKYNFGGVILFGQNTKEAGQTTSLIASMQKASIRSCYLRRCRRTCCVL